MATNPNRGMIEIVRMALEREFDLHDMPEDWLKGYTPFGEITRYLYLFGDLPEENFF